METEKIKKIIGILGLKSSGHECGKRLEFLVQRCKTYLEFVSQNRGKLVSMAFDLGRAE